MNDVLYRSELDQLIEASGLELFQRKVMADVLEGGSPRDLARQYGVTYADLWRWITEDEERYLDYQKALVGTADDLAHQSLQISDEADEDEVNVAAKKLRVETRMKLAGKWDRHRYGENMEMKVTGSVSLISLLASLPSDSTEIPVIEGQSERVQDGG